MATSILLFYLLFSLSLSQFQPIFVSFVTTFAALYFLVKHLKFIVYSFFYLQLSRL